MGNIVSYNLFSLYLVSAAFVCSSLKSTATNAKPSDLITNICSETRNATYCLNFLTRYDRPGITLQQLSLASIQDAILVVFTAKDTIHAGGLPVTDPRILLPYQLCEVQYSEALNALTEWENSVKSGGEDYKKLASLASISLKKPAECDANFAATKNEPAFIKDLNNDTTSLCISPYPFPAFVACYSPSGNIDSEINRLGVSLSLFEEDSRLIMPTGTWHAKPVDQGLFVVGRLLSSRTFHPDALQSTFLDAFKPVRGMEFKLIEGVRFLLKFFHSIDRQMVLTNCPWAYDKNLLVLAPLESMENPSSVDNLGLLYQNPSVY
ncbi:hypothetical protein Salat_1793600 [Sesamum alatum]|uniref:Pectinesterase inhibitor domain-containing protein n=1 Tax=Sesamum alatum TaxID=300844 RepID=A0AAE1Y938_9LAMI|nr:hypothetical protein Salat_1793600 [Sesamum alatum]